MYKKNLCVLLLGIVGVVPIAASEPEYLDDSYINISAAVVTTDVINTIPVYYQYNYQTTYGYEYPNFAPNIVVINRYHGSYYYSPCTSYNLYVEIPERVIYFGPSTDDNYCW